MILQVATLMVRPGCEAAFERTIAQAEPLLRDAAGYLSHELRRSVDNGQHYALLVEWRRLEDPTLGWRPSAGLVSLRQRLQGLLQGAPEVENFIAVPAPAAAGHLAD